MGCVQSLLPLFIVVSSSRLTSCGIDSINSRALSQGTKEEEIITYSTGNKMMIEETKRSIHDALCVARNLIRNNSIVYGGGSAEISFSRRLQISTLELSSYNIVAALIFLLSTYAIRAFADALDVSPMALAENSGLQPIETLTAVKSQQIKVVKMILKIDDVISPSEYWFINLSQRSPTNSWALLCQIFRGR